MQKNNIQISAATDFIEQPKSMHCRHTKLADRKEQNDDRSLERRHALQFSNSCSVEEEQLYSTKLVGER